MISFLTTLPFFSWRNPGLVGILLVTVVTLTVLSSSSVAWSQSQSPVSTDSGAVSVENAGKSVLIPIEGMTCRVCAARVRKTLKAIDGVTDVTVDLEHRNARVNYAETKTSANQLTAAINKLGYKAGAPAQVRKTGKGSLTQ